MWESLWFHYVCGAPLIEAHTCINLFFYAENGIELERFYILEEKDLKDIFPIKMFSTIVALYVMFSEIIDLEIGPGPLPYSCNARQCKVRKIFEAWCSTGNTKDSLILKNIVENKVEINKTKYRKLKKKWVNRSPSLSGSLSNIQLYLFDLYIWENIGIVLMYYHGWVVFFSFNYLFCLPTDLHNDYLLYVFSFLVYRRGLNREIISQQNMW